MAEKVTLKLMKCPTCGANLKVEDAAKNIVCVYCGNSVMPVADSTPVAHNSNTGVSGVVKVEGIKTSSSALAYIEQFFEEYDWEAFTYAQSLSVADIDALTDSLKVSSADDKHTWFACFKAISVPFIYKINGCKKILTSVIEEYKKDDLDAYGKFDAYQRIVAMIVSHKGEIIETLDRIVDKAIKYGALSAEVDRLNAEIDIIKNLAIFDRYVNIEAIPEIKTFIEQKNARIAQELAAEGVDAEKEYLYAKTLIAEKKYVAALNVLLSLKGYCDAKMLAEKIDKYFLISDVLEVEGVLYYYKNDVSTLNTFRLHPTENGKIIEKALIKDIGNIITNYADILYYLDDNGRLKRYNFATKTEEKLFKKRLSKQSIYVYGKKAFLLANCDDYNDSKHDLIELDLATGMVKTLLMNIRSIVSFADGKMVYTLLQKGNKESQEFVATNIIDVDTTHIVHLGINEINVEGFADHCVVFTRPAPNKYNKNLYIKALDSESPARLVEENIFRFCDVIADKLFYYIGNTRNQTLININCDGSERKEWPLYISELLFEQGGWLYFVRRAGYNSILCKSRLDGSKFSIIASDIDKFIKIKNGYLYYINSESALVKVRMDGSNWQELCEDVETVLAVREDKIVFVSVDDRITSGAFEMATTKIVKSVYAVDFSGSGKIKLAYNIKNAKEYDENTVYYTAVGNEKVDVLYKLDVETNRSEALLSIAVEEESKPLGCAAILLPAIVACFLAFLGLVSDSEGLTVFGIVVAFISIVVGLVVSFNKQT